MSGAGSRIPTTPPEGPLPADTSRGPEVVCPFCGSVETELFSLFGSSALTSQYYCRSCRTPFERVKWGAQPPRF